jgi:hypothetical protein
MADGNPLCQSKYYHKTGTCKKLSWGALGFCRCINFHYCFVSQLGCAGGILGLLALLIQKGFSSLAIGSYCWTLSRAFNNANMPLRLP